MSAETQQRAIDFAKNFSLISSDSTFMGPVTVGNVGVFNDRAIVNLCVRTLKSNPRNASISFPLSWVKATQFKPGDQVNIKIENGYVRKLWAARPEPVKSTSHGETDQGTELNINTTVGETKALEVPASLEKPF